VKLRPSGAGLVAANRGWEKRGGVEPIGARTGGQLAQAACVRGARHSRSLDAWRCRLARTLWHMPWRDSVARGLCGSFHRRARLPWRDRGCTPEGWARDTWPTRTGGWRVPVRARPTAAKRLNYFV
jgi:hypothetical protein